MYRIVAYDIMDKNRLMRGYGVQDILVDVIKRIYNGSMIQFEIESITTIWCNGDSGVKQGCLLSPLLFNRYVRELGMKVAACKQGFKYEVCLMASNEQDLQMIFDNISGCISEYGMEVSERKKS